MKELIKKAEELLAELKAKETEGMEPVKNQVQLSALVAGERFKTGIGNFIVLEQGTNYAKVIQEGFFAEDVNFDSNSSDYTKSELKRLFDTTILEAYEYEFGADNLIEQKVDLKSVDMQDYDTFTCKVRPITFDEAREFNQFLVKEDLPDWWWTCTPWSTKERGLGSSVTVVSPRGFISRVYCNVGRGVRPVCILKSNIFVSKVEE